VDRVLERFFVLSMQAHGVDEIPFIWFWPDGHKSCAIMTHDIEEAAGVKACESLMDIESNVNVLSSFQFVPESRYSVSKHFLDSVRRRGFEVNVHDLNHDGHLYDDRAEFLRRAEKINHYVQEFGAQGFRSAVVYRNLDWYNAFTFSYDMSVPNVSHLDPQRGGCCTVMPFFIGDILELPLTTTQDYSLFHILGDYSIDLWKRQIETITNNHGLVSFDIHPDYVAGGKPHRTYRALLDHLCRLRSDGQLYTALPREVNSWWRIRQELRLVQVGRQWRIEGPNNERARVAYARRDGEKIVYELDPDLTAATKGAATNDLAVEARELV
jgi:hypothetical protein